MPRSTIHFYIREGLLPRPHKKAASRSLYSQDHVRLLNRITELKAAGRSLAEIRSLLEEDVARSGQQEVDLAKEESERTRRNILRVATVEFAEKGYARTHVDAIIKKAKVTPQVFYSHFSSKLDLLVQSFHTFLTWNLAFFEPRLKETPDLGERLLYRLLADTRANEFGSDVMAQIRSEGSRSRSERLKLAQQAWDQVIGFITKEFEGVRPADSPPVPIPLELLAYSMLGAHHNASARASWDDKFSRTDVLRTHLWLWLCVLAAIGGEVDIDSRLAKYEALIQEIAEREADMPPAVEE